MGHKKEVIENRIANGLCTVCGDKSRNNYKTCEKCADKARQKTKKHREKHKVAGLCVNCSDNSIDGSQYCEKHRNSQRLSQRKCDEEWRLQKTNAGLCSDCGENKPISGKRICKQCKDAYVERSRKLRIKRIDNGLCARCEEPAVFKRKMCEKHLEENRLKEKRKRERRKDKNICIKCGQQPPRPGKVQCFPCSEIDKDKHNAAKMDVYYQRRSAGVCVRCGEPTDNFSVHCDKCSMYMRKKDKIRHDKSKEAGLCIHCHKSFPVDGEVLCLPCKKKSVINGARNRSKQKLAIIDHYGGKCRFCGETDSIVLCIDHIDGGGNQHREQLRSKGISMYRWLIKNNYPIGFQVLCYNCNMRKYMNSEVSPHKNIDNVPLDDTNPSHPIKHPQSKPDMHTRARANHQNLT